MNKLFVPVGTDIADVAPGLRDRRVLVTGANGFIGTRLVERLLAECQARPRALLRSYSRAARLARFGLDQVEIVIGSLAEPATLARAVDGCTVVFHCAYDRGDLDANRNGMHALIEACSRHRVRLIHVSTFSVYEPLPDGELAEEADPVRSGIPYSETKLDVEGLVLAAVEQGRLDATVIMPTIVYGPNAKGWTLFPASQLKNGTVLLPENGEGLCNAVYVDDVCQALIRAAVAPSARGRRYLISGETPVTWYDFYKAYADALDLAPPQPLPSMELSRRTRNPSGALRLLLGDPKRIVQWGPLRRVAMAAKNGMTPSQKNLVKRVYGIYRRFAPQPVYAPSGQLRQLLSARCRVRIDRARSELGYQPAFDFDRGMLMTGAWLRWAMPSD